MPALMGGFLRRYTVNMCFLRNYPFVGNPSFLREHAFVADKAESSRMGESNEVLSEGLVNNPKKIYSFQSIVGCFFILFLSCVRELINHPLLPVRISI